MGLLWVALSALALMGEPPAFVDTACLDARLEGLARCGRVRVPENRDARDGRAIDLNVVVLPAPPGDGPRLPPLFDIDGGPGLPATKNAAFYLTAGAAYRQGRDIVLVDQRGTGGSNPLLCPELARPEDAYAPMLPVEGVIACRTRLEQLADLTRYGTAEAVRDLEVVRQALGHEQVDLFALSYGTTVALRYMAAHPGRTRAAVLMGAAPPHAMPPRHHAPAGQRALDLLFQDCAEDPACRAAFPSPAADLDTALDRLAGEPNLAPEIFAEKLRALMYSPAGARQVPYILSRAAAGDLEPFYAATRPSEPLPYADGMFLSVTCAEGVALMDGAVAAAAARATRFGDYRLRRQGRACEHWPAAAVAENHLSLIRTEAAVLFISGRLDPVTPPEWADELAANLPNARHVVLRYGGHMIDGLAGADTCFDPLIVEFLIRASVADLDETCVADMAPPPFRLHPGD